MTYGFGGQFSCPQCGFGTQNFGSFGTYAPGYGAPSYGPGMGTQFGGFGTPWGYGTGWGLGGLRRWGGTYSPQYTSTGLPTDEEIEEMIYDAIDDDPLIPWDADIEVKCEAGECTLVGTVPNKRIKHAAGDDAWWVPGVVDVHNTVSVTGRRRTRSASLEETSEMEMEEGTPTTMTSRGSRGTRL